DAALLAYLAIEGQAPRATLLELLWPDVQRGAARNHLRQLLYRLRRAVGVELVEGNELLALAEGIEVDLRDADAFSTASELLTGLDYDHFPQFDVWLTNQRARVRRAQCDALASKCSQLEGDGKLAEAIAVAETLVALTPLEEHAHQRLMHLHYLRGDRSASIAAFERCERLLKDELGARPGAETLALLKVVESAASAPRRAAVRTIPASIVKPPRMIGRENDLAALRGACDAGRVPLVVGAPGLGQSRLVAGWPSHLSNRIAVRGRPGDSTAPYALLARWLRAIEEHDAGAIAQAPPEVLAAVLTERASAPAHARVTHAVVRAACERVIEAALQHGLRACIVDDLHWADAASLELLQHLILAERVETCHWVLAQRPAERDDSAVASLLNALSEVNRVVVVKLAPLDKNGIAELVDSLTLPDVVGTELAASLARHTGGNPLFVLETLKEALIGGVGGRRLA